MNGETHGLLSAIESSWLAALLKSSFYVYPAVSALHILAIGWLVASVVLLDLRTLGLLPAQSESFAPLTRRLAFGAFAVAILTGAALFAVRATDYAENPAFLVKMSLIALAGLNFIAFTTFGNIAVKLRNALAALSIAIWIAIAFCGRFIAFV